MQLAKPHTPADDTAERTAICCKIVFSDAQSVTVDTFGREPKRPEWLARDRGLIA